MNLARDNILGRVRAALRTEAHRPAAPTDAPIWPAMGDVESLFRSEFQAVKGEWLTRDELPKFLAGFGRIATDNSELVLDIVGPGNAITRDCELSVTGCECLVAQTGSIVVSTLSSGGRALSVLPPVHLAIARREQLLPDLAAALALLRQRYSRRWPSSLSIVTGPSRTADIEKILVLGAHGPKRLLVFVAD